MIKALGQWLQRYTHPTQKKETRCLCCGACCEAFGGHLNASKSDLERWRREGRDDLISRVNRLGWIWVDPHTKQPEERCPFLDRSNDTTALCAIQETKPDMCRAYPTLANGRRCLRGVFLKAVPLLAGFTASGVDLCSKAVTLLTL